MKFVIRHFAIALLAAAANTAFATAADSSRQRVDISAQASALAAAQKVLALRDFDNTYELSNGRSMVVTSFGSAVRVSYGRRQAKTLRHDGNGNFVSQDGKLVLQFDLDRDGAPHQVRLTLPAEWL